MINGFAIVFLLTGCALFEQVGPAEMVIEEDHQQLVSTINTKLEETSELYDTIVIAGSEKIIVTYKVRHLNRFQMKAIEKELTKWLKEEFTDREIDVSSDYKIFLESYKLLQSWEKDSITSSEAEKKLEEIIKLKNEMT